MSILTNTRINKQYYVLYVREKEKDESFLAGFLINLLFDFTLYAWCNGGLNASVRQITKEIQKRFTRILILIMIHI